VYVWLGFGEQRADCHEVEVEAVILGLVLFLGRLLVFQIESFEIAALGDEGLKVAIDEVIAVPNNPAEESKVFFDRAPFHSDVRVFCAEGPDKPLVE
jgi:hypothetical protein